MHYQVGDIIRIERGNGYLSVPIPCVVMATSPEDGRVTKAKVIYPEPEMARQGFILEEGDFYAVEWHWSSN